LDVTGSRSEKREVPPSGGSLEIGNLFPGHLRPVERTFWVPPSGGSLEIGNHL